MRLKRGLEAGFSLIELAVVLVIIGLLVGGGIVALEVGTERQRRAETERALEDVRAALYGFAMREGRLPCPDTDDPPTGSEDSDCSDAAQGVLPWSTLGLGRRDAWGDEYLYAVDGDYARDPPTPGGTAFDFEARGALQVESSVSVGDAVTLADDVAAVVVSFGGQGRQVWADGLDCSEPEGFSDDEEANCDGNAEFVAADFRRADAAEGRFDDIVVWLPDAVLKARLVDAERLP